MLVSLNSIATAGEVTCAGLKATVVGGSNEKEVEGTPEDDVIAVEASGVTIRALDGDDVVCGSRISDTIYGGRGADRLFGRNNEPGSRLREGDAIHGGTGADFVSGLEGRDELYGGAGADVLEGDDSPDEMRGGEGPDRLDGGPRDDRLIDGQAGDDFMRTGGGGATMATGPGDDTYRTQAPWGRVPLDYGSESAIVADLEEGVVTGESVGRDHIDGLFFLYATKFADKIFGSREADHISAEGGDDKVTGRAESDVIWLGPGDDHGSGGNGMDMIDPGRASNGSPDVDRDSISGGDSFDRIEVLVRNSNININLSTQTLKGSGGDSMTGIENAKAVSSKGSVTLVGDEGWNSLVGQGVSHGSDPAVNIRGRRGNDTILVYVFKGEGVGVASGGWGNDFMEGNSSVDRFKGNGGHDELWGGTGKDRLSGGEGDDVAVGSADNDRLDGGPGGDALDGGTDAPWYDPDGVENDLCLNGEQLHDCERTTEG